MEFAAGPPALAWRPRVCALAATTHTPVQPPPWCPPTPLPGPVRTPRLVLRFWQPPDAQGMLEAINVDRGSLLQWLPWVETDNRTVSECIYSIERFRRDRESPDATDYTIGIFDHAGGVVGGTGLHRVARETHEGEIGYWVRADRRRQGFCAEAVAHLLSSALSGRASGGWGLRRVKIVCAAGNVASQLVPRKLGLREEARLVGNRWTRGTGWDDTLMWSVLAHEWDVRSHRLREG